MKRVVAMWVACLAVWLGLLAVSATSATVAVYAYDAHHHFAPVTYVISEGSPPAADRSSVGATAVDSWAREARALQRAATSVVHTYAASTPPVQIATGRPTGEEQVGRAVGAFSSLASNVVAANTGSEVMLDTSAVVARDAARGLMKPGECAAICSTVSREAGEHGFSAAGLPVVADGTSATLRAQVAQQLRGFGAKAQGFDNDVVIGATALERGSPLITGDWALANTVSKLGGDARWFAPGG